MARIFISYASDRKRVVKRLSRDLEAAGHDVWWAPKLTGGQDWWDKILSEIRAADVVIFAATPDALASPGCLAECAYGEKCQRKVVPVWLSAIRMSGRLGRLQAIDYQTETGPAELVDLLRTQPSPVPLPEPLPNPPRYPVARNRRDTRTTWRDIDTAEAEDAVRTLEGAATHLDESVETILRVLHRVLDETESWRVHVPGFYIEIGRKIRPESTAVDVAATTSPVDRLLKNRGKMLQKRGWDTFDAFSWWQVGGIGATTLWGFRALTGWNLVGASVTLLWLAFETYVRLTHGSMPRKTWVVTLSRTELPAMAKELQTVLQLIDPSAKRVRYERLG